MQVISIGIKAAIMSSGSGRFEKGAGVCNSPLELRTYAARRARYAGCRARPLPRLPERGSLSISDSQAVSKEQPWLA